MKKAKEVKIVRVEKGQEAAGAAKIEDIYNGLNKGDRASRAVITAAGDDVVYTIYIDRIEDDDALDWNDVIKDDTPKPDDDEDDDDDAIPFC